MRQDDVELKKATIPVKWLFGLIPLIIGGAGWMSQQAYSGQINTSRLTSLEQAFEKQQDLLRSIDERTARIEGTLKRHERTYSDQD